ncbi:MAG: GTP-binding protein [Candidatus Thorarchaeota archaeon]|nr:MAG: GTP-binding protein [Candidatus Thorarchaeota archaeon]
MLTTPRILFEIDDELSTSAIDVGNVTNSALAELCTGGRDGVLRLYDANQEVIRLLASRDVNGSILSIKISDANNDGLMEIVVGRSIGGGETAGSAGTVQVYRFAPSGAFELLAEHAIDRFVTSVYVTDVTGDGKNEIIAGGSDSTLRILSMDSENNCTEIIRYQLDDMPLAIGTCDVIGDEIEEIVTGNRDRTLRVLKVKDHSVEQIEALELPSPVISVAAGDILGDRKMELGVVTHDGSIRVYRNEESKLDLFAKLEGVNAQSVRMAEMNSDHMDEIVVATSDYKILFYSLYMAELRQIAEVDLGYKILSIAVGDAGGDERREVLVGVSNGPLKVIEGLYQIIPKFEVLGEAAAGANLRGKLTVVNVTDKPLRGVSGKLYWFPKDNMDISPQQIRFDLEPHETKSMELELVPKAQGSVIVRPIVLMWTEADGEVRQVTTPETAVLVEEGAAIAAAADIQPGFQAAEMESSALFTAASETSEAAAKPIDVETTVSSAAPAVEDSKLREAEALLDKLFGEQIGGAEILDIQEPAAEPAVTPAAPTVVSPESTMISEIRARPAKPQRPGIAPDTYAYLFKVMVIGEGAVGKTALVNRYTTGAFEKDYKTTIGSQFAVKLTHVSPPESEYGVGIKLQAWDVAGQARFKAVRKMYYSGAAGIILVFDVTRRRSFAELIKWVSEADESIGMRVAGICVGNKVDLPDRAVPSDEAKKWAEDEGFLYMESSALTGQGVADMFTVLAELMWREARRTLEEKKKGI